MIIKKRIAATLLSTAVLGAALVNFANAGAREEGRLLTATEVLEEVQAMPDSQIPDALLSRAYGIAVIPDVTKVAFFFGGRHGNGVLVVRDKLNLPMEQSNLRFPHGRELGIAGRSAILRHHSGIHDQDRHRGHCRRQADSGRGRVRGDRTRRPAGIGGHRHELQCGNLFLRAHPRAVRRHCPGRQRDLHRPFGECVPVRQERRHGHGDFFRARRPPRP